MIYTCEELEMWNNGHTYECFHNLDIEVINAETKSLHHSAHLFYEKPDVKSKMLFVTHNFAFTKDFSRLKKGKLAGSTNQRNPNYKLSTKEESDVEHGFVENFCQLFSFRERLRKINQEVSKKRFTAQYNSLMGNLIFHATVFYKSCSLKN